MLAQYPKSCKQHTRWRSCARQGSTSDALSASSYTNMGDRRCIAPPVDQGILIPSWPGNCRGTRRRSCRGRQSLSSCRRHRRTFATVARAPAAAAEASAFDLKSAPLAQTASRALVLMSLNARVSTLYFDGIARQQFLQLGGIAATTAASNGFWFFNIAVSGSYVFLMVSKCAWRASTATLASAAGLGRGSRLCNGYSRDHSAAAITPT